MRQLAASALDAALEALVVPSFSKLGYHARRWASGWRPLDSYDLHGSVVVLTGGTSGIGLAASEAIARCGASLVVLGRDAERTEAAASELRRRSGNQQVSSVIADMGDYEAVRGAAGAILERHERLDVLIHNAGALTAERRTAPDGTELTVASQVVGPFLLTALLLGRLSRSAPARVLTMSSGGMYLARPRFDELEMDATEYDGARQYARAKRAQVVLTELWAARTRGSGVVFHALHPGWVGTPGISAALPRFYSLLGPVLRSPAEGADTLVWLAADGAALSESGRFWHDRRRRGTHRVPSTWRADTAQERRRLWEFCCERSGWDGDVRTIVRRPPATNG